MLFWNGTFYVLNYGKDVEYSLESEYCREGGVILNIKLRFINTSTDQRIYDGEFKLPSYGFGVRSG